MTSAGIDCVYGFFEPFINTHTDIDQQLARVRNPGSVKVWFKPGRFDFDQHLTLSVMTWPVLGSPRTLSNGSAMEN
jgi:hypothetical protein